jgi:hypothetical protein
VTVQLIDRDDSLQQRLLNDGHDAEELHCSFFLKLGEVRLDSFFGNVSVEPLVLSDFFTLALDGASIDQGDLLFRWII